MICIPCRTCCLALHHALPMDSHPSNVVWILIAFFLHTFPWKSSLQNMKLMRWPAFQGLFCMFHSENWPKKPQGRLNQVVLSRFCVDLPCHCALVCLVAPYLYIVKEIESNLLMSSVFFLVLFASIICAFKLSLFVFSLTWSKIWWAVDLE